MKKLMIVTAAVALAAVAEAGIAVKTINCTNPGSKPGCDQVVFKVTGSGKALDPVTKDYLSVGKLKVNGWLVMFPAEYVDPATQIATGDCCYPTYSLYVSAKVGKNTTNLIFAGADTEPIDAWSVFGAKLSDAETSIATLDEKSKSKKFKLDSQLGISADYVGGNASGTLVYAEDIAANDGEPYVTFIATAFGKATWNTKFKAACQKCDKPSYEGYDLTFGTYSGWFAGFYLAQDGLDEECLTCACTDLGLFGGTWKAKYQTKISTWEAAAADLFGAKALADLREEGIE
jgi:hypothetical protein